MVKSAAIDATSSSRRLIVARARLVILFEGLNRISHIEDAVAAWRFVPAGGMRRQRGQPERLSYDWRLGAREAILTMCDDRRCPV